MNYFGSDDARNAKAQERARHCFEEVVFQIERGDLLDVLEHLNPERYAGQRILVAKRDDYVRDSEDDHAEPEGDEPVFGRGVGR